MKKLPAKLRIEEFFTYALDGHMVVRAEAAAKRYAGWKEISRIKVSSYGGSPVENLVLSPPVHEGPPLPLVTAEPLGDEAGAALDRGGLFDKPESIESEFGKCWGTITKLFNSANQGDAKALGMLAEIAVHAGRSLSELTRVRPAALAPIARKHVRWPLMRSTHPLNSDSDEWLNQMALGSAYPFALNSGCHWKPDRAANIALSIYQHLAHLRTEARGTIDGKPIASVLPLFNRSTAAQWWDIGWYLLLHTYPEPHKVRELESLVKGKSKRKYPSTIKEEVRVKLKARFIAIAKT